jgi:hypothetical protein
MPRNKQPWYYDPESRLYRLCDAILITDLIALTIGGALGAIAAWALQDYFRT